MSRDIAVYGAGGYTGQLIVAELLRRGLPLRVGARRAEALKCWQSEIPAGRRHTFELASKTALASFLDGAAIAINCAGPFAATAPALCTAALNAKCHYLDITAEPHAVVKVTECLARRPSALASAVVPGIGFFGALADLLIAILLQRMPAPTGITVAYAVDGWRPTPGTLKAATEGARNRYTFTNGTLKEDQSPPALGQWKFPAPIGQVPVLEGYPAPELVLTAHASGASSFRTLMTAATLRALAGTPLASGEAQDKTTFALHVVLQNEARTTWGQLTGRDIYGLTAPLVADLTAALLTQPTASGLRRPSELVDPHALLSALPGVALTFGDEEELVAADGFEPPTKGL